MPKPNQPPSVRGTRRDQARMTAGKSVLKDVAAGVSDTGLIGMDDLKDAIYYLDGTLFIGAGMSKAGRKLREEAKKRGLL
jgi:hypothetical protein